MLDIRHKIKRRERINLKQLRTEEKKKKSFDLMTFDIETWGLNPSNLALCSFYNGEIFHNFYCKDDIIEFLDSIGKDTIIYAHNGSKYDISIFFDELMFSNEWFMLKTGDILHVRYTNKKEKKIVFKDSYNILHDSLKNLAKSFLKQEEQKLVLDDKFKNPEKRGFKKEKYLENIKEYNLKHITKKDIEYCNRDTEVLYKIITNDVFEKFGFDFINKNTIASIAYSKLLENIQAITIDNNKDLEYLTLYSGGLTDVYRHTNDENTKVLCLDYNSSYPYQMTKEFADPYHLQRYYYGEIYGKELEKEIDNFWNMLENFPNGYSEVSIKIKETLTEKETNVLQKIPLFPLRGMNFYDYATGDEYLITVMNIELKNLIPFFNIKPIYSMYSKKMITPFKDYITTIYRERQIAKQNNDSSKSLILKLLMNSAYGRLGLKTNTEGNELGSFEYIKETVLKNLDRSIEIIKNDGFSYIYELAEERLDRIHQIENEIEFLKDEKEIDIKRLELLKYIRAFIIELSQDIDGYKIKTINKIPKYLLEDSVKDKDFYMMSYTTEKKPHKESCYYLASEITSKARAQLIKDMLDIELSELGSICYTDTDSLHIQTKDITPLKDYLKDKIDDTKIGYLSSDGEFDKGFWLVKKHYYLFKKDEKGRMVFSKSALKGFTPQRNLDYFVHTSPEVFVNKIYSRISNINTDTNTLIDSKTFLNFTTKRDRQNRLLKLFDNHNKTERIYHSQEIQDIYFSILKSGIYYIENDNKELEILTIDKVNGRITELQKEYQDKKDANIFMYDVVNFHFTNETINTKLKKILKKEIKPKEKKDRKKPKGISNILKKYRKEGNK